MAVFLGLVLVTFLALSIIAMRVRSGVKLLKLERLVAGKVPFDSKALQWLGWPSFIGIAVIATLVIGRLYPASVLLGLGAVMLALLLEVKRARKGRAEGNTEAGYVLGRDILDQNAWYARYVRTTNRTIPYLAIVAVFLMPGVPQVDVAAIVIYLVWAHLDLLERKPKEQESSAS